MRHLWLGVLLFCVCFGAVGNRSVSAQSPGGDKHKMSNAEYSRHLDRIENDIDKWEVLLRKIDPGKGDPTYSVGKRIADNLNLALLEVANSRNYIQRERTKRSIYGEIALSQFLASLSADFSELAYAGAFNDLSVEAVAKVGDEIGFVQSQLVLDGLDRLTSLSKID